MPADPAVTLLAAGVIMAFPLARTALSLDIFAVLVAAAGVQIFGRGDVYIAVAGRTDTARPLIAGGGAAVGRVDRGEIPAVGGIAVLRQRDVDIGGEISAARLRKLSALEGGGEDKAAGGAVIGARAASSRLLSSVEPSGENSGCKGTYWIGSDRR